MRDSDLEVWQMLWDLLLVVLAVELEHRRNEKAPKD